MELLIAGGVGEHGRNCFYVAGRDITFLVDCGIMAETGGDPYPHLSNAQIEKLNAVFLTHSHADHTGALPWLYERGFRGTVIASRETLNQLPNLSERVEALEAICPAGAGIYGSLCIAWGRSGHCAGSVWYRFQEEASALFFSGDYTEDTQVYACDPIRGQQADIAVLDCAYGWERTDYETACSQLTAMTGELLKSHGLLLFPVPRYGRGLELLKLLADSLLETEFFGDGCFRKNLESQRAGGFWYNGASIDAAVGEYCGQHAGVVFISDPQLKRETSRKTAAQILSLGGMAVMTGTLERGSYSDWLLKQMKMKLLRYPVHLNYAQYRSLVQENHFGKSIPYHSPAHFLNAM